MKTFSFFLLIVLVFTLSASAASTTILLEAESFEDTGGWLIDQQSIDAMGSPYLLAHGLGRPVADAITKVAIPEAGQYRVFARTKDWVARWKAPGAPGRFKILIDGKPTGPILGTKGVDWDWQDAGKVELDKGEVKVALHDLTGFEGRCDSVILTNDPDFVPPQGEELKTWRRKILGTDGPPTEQGKFDVVVIGGGVAGTCAAISSARLGLDVALIQNRPLLGGNSSSEIRVWIKGKTRQKPYPILGEIVDRMNTKPDKSPGDCDYGDDVKLKMVQAEKRIKLFLCEHVDEVRSDGKRITAVVSGNTKTGRRSIYRGRWFVDCTGDGTVGFMAGADSEVTKKGHLGASNMWYTHDIGKPAPFPQCPWAVQVGDNPAPQGHVGPWYWESGFDMDTVQDAETIRDSNFRGMYGVWSYLKNEKKLYPNRELKWAAYVSGRRESRRLMGDVVLTADDIRAQRAFPDASVTSTWSIDLHYPVEKYIPLQPQSPFISHAKFEHLKKPYPVPYRCFYSRNIDNLFMAGRCISVTHQALGTVRVMGTCGMMGEVVGRAAYLCKKHDGEPRDVYAKHLDELKKLMKTSLYDEK
ncbi:MAG: FAD-dependent oxidoreductase [Pirellulales bacterium]|nr:FAD-dependent oxidoreductase [Pirellulales bacterium]